MTGASARRRVSSSFFYNLNGPNQGAANPSRRRVFLQQSGGYLADWGQEIDALPSRLFLATYTRWLDWQPQAGRSQPLGDMGCRLVLMSLTEQDLALGTGRKVLRCLAWIICLSCKTLMRECAFAFSSSMDASDRAVTFGRHS